MKIFANITSAVKHRLLRPIAVLALALPCTSFAHHSQSEFDPQLPLELEGTVTKLEWKSPHARLYMDVVDKNGATANWNFELPSPNTMMRRGWKNNALKPGDRVTVTGIRARNFPLIGIVRTVKDKDGNSMFTGTTPINE